VVTDPHALAPAPPAGSVGPPRRLTVALVAADDAESVHVTLTALRLGHAEALDDVDFLVVDTRPHAPAAWSLKALEWNVPRLRYVPAADARGTAAAKDLVFTIATWAFDHPIDVYLGRTVTERVFRVAPMVACQEMLIPPPRARAARPVRARSASRPAADARGPGPCADGLGHDLAAVRRDRGSVADEPARPVAGPVAGSVAGFGGGGTDRDRSDGDRPRRAAAGLGPAHRTCLRPAGPAAARRAAAGVPGGGAVGGVGGGARGGVWQHGR
jgi:hypothetical protein